MNYTTLISTEELAQHLGDPDWAIIDCRFALADTGLGRREYRQAHIPGAVYAHLDEDLSGPVTPGVTGRHPLPAVEAISRKLSEWGIGPGVQVAAYDGSGGAIAAARLWWLLHWLDHPAAAVLDGGWQAWQAEGRPIRTGEETRPAQSFTPGLRNELLASAGEVEEISHDRSYRLLDARAHDRYLGQNETIDPVAGHIPGAVSAPYAGNLTPQGKFRPAEELRQRYLQLLGEVSPERAVIYCGSGVTAAHNLLAMAHAGLGLARMYAGSWSEWITNSEHPIER
jgi:thiosulfate/3-mercaptopyruvate sulfurtransferase